MAFVGPLRTAPEPLSVVDRERIAVCRKHRICDQTVRLRGDARVVIILFSFTASIRVL
jgi:hypothetical protein